jgi:hypothetical protein
MQITGDIYVQDDILEAEKEAFWDHPMLEPVPVDHAEDVSLGEHLRIKGRTPELGLWPERFPDGIGLIKRLRDRHPITSEFNRLFMSTCRDDGEAMCKAEWVELCKKNARDRGIHTMTGKRVGGDTYTGVDLAFSKSDSADYTAIFTIEILPSMHRKILDVQFGKWSAPEIKNRILDVHNRYGSIVRVENNSAQKMLIDLMADENRGMPIKGHTTGNNKANPTTGVHAVFNDMAHGLWLIPNDAAGRCHPAIQRWIDECLYYTPDSHTGDLLMSSWFCREQARAYGALRKEEQGKNSGLSGLLAR